MTLARRGRLCLTTVTDEQYLPGTLVMLSSFLLNNSWFDGDIVILHRGLSERSRGALAAFPSVSFQCTSDALERRLSTLCRHFPSLANKSARFGSLDAFALPYDTVLFFDSDILCLGNAAGLLKGDAGLSCAPDLAYWRGRVRDAETFVAVDERRWPAAADVLKITFNAGVMVIRPRALDENAYPGLLELLTPATWSGIRSGHTDQVVLNRYFRDSWQPLSACYNVLVTAGAAGFVRPQPDIDDAVFLHFIGRPKPWDVTVERRDDVEEVPLLRAGALSRWKQAWSDFRAGEFSRSLS